MIGRQGQGDFMRKWIATIAVVASFGISAGRCDESQDARGPASGPLVIVQREGLTLHVQVPAQAEP